MIELIAKAKNQYKANLHCHSVLSDGHKTPQELKEMYRAHGYSVLSITDHEVPFNHSNLAEKDFLMLTGYEAYIRPDPSAVYDPYSPEIHLNLFAKEPENETFICYNPSYAKYIHHTRPPEELKRAGSERTREYNLAYIQEFIDTARENGYLVSYNHPYWSMESEETILSYQNCFSMEICNGSSRLSNGLEYSAPLYDRMLLAGKHIFCHAGDDNHNTAPDGSAGSDSFRAYTYILADELTYPAIIRAMEKGDFYASRGPVLHAVSADGRKIHVECSPAKHIYVYTGSKSPLRVHAEDGACLTCADLEVDKRARYVRVSVFDESGNSADTRGFFPEELGWC